MPGPGRHGANERLNLGVIGVGGRGAANMEGVKTENIAALCDVDAANLAQAAVPHPRARQYRDWRRLLDRNDLDAVLVNGTDHTHAAACVWAMNRGLSVYCEKPLALTPYEARYVQDTYRRNRHRLATQMGTQVHARPLFRQVVDIVTSGAVGAVSAVHVWCSREGLPDDGRPPEQPPVPETLDWDLWLGPAPYRPYHPSYLPGCKTWEQWWDFGNGCLGDMGSHLLDLPFCALGLRDPVTVAAQGAPVRQEPYPRWLKVQWEHPARGDLPPLTLNWYDGIQRPESPPGQDLNEWSFGVLFVGDKGQLLADYSKWILLPEKEFRDYVPPAPSAPPAPGHYEEWLLAAKTGTPTSCNFDYSGKLIEHNTLGPIPYRVGRKLTWDAASSTAVNCPEANALIRREYRQGWLLDG